LHSSSSDCLSNEPPHYFKESCFDELDFAVTQATAAGVWAILTARSTLGERGPRTTRTRTHNAAAVTVYHAE